jgi:hypothetical protein
MNRVEHVLFGAGTVVEPRITESGKSAYLVRFDASETDRLILASAVKLSNTKEVKTKTKKKPRSRKATEPISDELIVPELDENLADDTLTAESEETQPLEV